MGYLFFHFNVIRVIVLGYTILVKLESVHFQNVDA